MKKIIRLASRGESDRSSLKTHKKWDKVLRKEGFTLLYLGHAVLSDARASSEVTLAIMAVKQSPTDQKRVQIYCQGPQLYVKERMGEEGEQELLTSPLTNISQCLQHTAQGFNDCFGLVFSSGPWIKQCHIFQAKSNKEVSDNNNNNNMIIITKNFNEQLLQTQNEIINHHTLVYYSVNHYWLPPSVL